MSLRIYTDVEQRSDEWHDLRRGMVTASAVGQLISITAPDPMSVNCPGCEAAAGDPCVSLSRKTPTPLKNTHGARSDAAADRPPVYSVASNDTSRAVTAALVAERITGHSESGYMSSDMLRGVLHEPIARGYYEQHHGRVTEVGFMVLEAHGWTLGYSPDGLVGEDGLLEIKAPKPTTHLRTILAGEMPARHMAQVQAGLLVSGRKWLDFCSFFSGMPLFVTRVYPDPQWFEAIEAACHAFEDNARELVADYRSRIVGLPMTERIPDDLELVI